MSTRTQHTRPRRSRGGVLVAVLGFIMLFSIFVVQFLDIVTRQMRIRAIELGRADLRTTAYSALQTTLAVLNEFADIDEGLHSPSQGWGDPLGYAGITFPEGIQVNVRIEDETGKLSLLEPIPETQLRLLLEQIGVRYDDADIMVDSLLDWIDEDDLIRLNGAEEAYYQRQNPPILPANAPLRTFDTLAHIRGFKDIFFDEKGTPNEMFYAFVNSTSLHNRAPINLNTAPAPILAMIAENSSFDDRLFTQQITGQDRSFGTTDDLIIRSADDLRQAGFHGELNEVGYEIAVLRINIEVSAGDKSFHLNALFETDTNSSGDNNNNNNNNRPGNNQQGGDADTPPSPDQQAGSPRINVPRRGQSPTPGTGTSRQTQNSSGNAGSSRLTLLRSVENAHID